MLRRSPLRLLQWLGSSAVGGVLVWACSGGSASVSSDVDAGPSDATMMGSGDGMNADMEGASSTRDEASTQEASLGSDASTPPGDSDTGTSTDAAADVALDAPADALGDAHTDAAADAHIDASDAGSIADAAPESSCAIPCNGICYYAGQCATAVTTDTTRGLRLVVSGTSAYWTDPYGSQVRTVPLTGGASTAVATGQGNPSGIDVDTSEVYWVNNNGQVMRAPFDGGTPSTVVSGYGGLDLGVLGTDVYWSYPGGNLLLKVSKAGGAVSTLASATSSGPPIALSGLALDSAHVYWTLQASPGYLKRAALDGGAPATVATDTAGQPYQMAVDGTYAYWIDGVSVLKAPLGGGTITTLASEPTAVDIAADATGVYWITADAKVVHAGSNDVPVILTYPPVSDATCIALDANYVYWLDEDIIQPLMKVAK